MSGSHGHGGHGGTTTGSRPPAGPAPGTSAALLVSFFLIVGFLVVQVVVGIATGSLALLSDAGHMATDALGLGMALAAIHAASASRTNPQRTFGLYRLEILAALANAVLLFGVAAYVLYEAVIRLGEDREIASLPVLIVGVLGLAVNIVAFLLLRQGAKESLNVEGAYLEVLSDALGSLGVIVGAIVWGVTGWTWVDPVIGAAIGLFILPRAFRLGREAVRILVQAAPERIDVPRCRADLAGIPGRGRRPRPPRVDAHLRHGGGLGPPDGADRDRQPRRARPGPRPAGAAPRARSRHAADRTRGPPRLRRDQLVTARTKGQTRS